MRKLLGLRMQTLCEPKLRRTCRCVSIITVDWLFLLISSMISKILRSTCRFTTLGRSLISVVLYEMRIRLLFSVMIVCNFGGCGHIRQRHHTPLSEGAEFMGAFFSQTTVIVQSLPMRRNPLLHLSKTSPETLTCLYTNNFLSKVFRTTPKAP